MSINEIISNVHKMGSSLLFMQGVPSLLLLFLVCPNIWYSNAQTTYANVPALFPPQDCPNLSPCTCYQSFDNTIYVDCNEVPMEEIRLTFTRISPPIDIDDLRLFIRSPPGDSIPGDLLGQSRVRGVLEIIGQYDLPPLLRVDPNAFRSSSDSLQSISFQQLDSSELDFGFLAGFKNLSKLVFIEIPDLQRSLPSLPALPALTTLYFGLEPSLNTAFTPGDSALKCDGLITLDISYCGINDFGLAQLLDWVLPSSAKTLRAIYITDMDITSIPLQMASFQALQDIYFSRNTESLVIPSNAIYFNGEDTGDNNSTFPSIAFIYAGLNYVGPGAFQGNYRFTQVKLNGNELSRFEEAAFKSMLQDMSTGTGFLDVQPLRDGFDCFTDPCHLAWLLRDNRYLLGSLKNAQCTDGTPLADLPLTLFENCTNDSITLDEKDGFQDED